MATIGFVGLGHMGLPMAINLVKAGHQVIGYDVNPLAMALFSQSGGVIASTLADVAIGQEVLITMLQTGLQVKAVCLGEEGLFGQSKKGTLHIDCSTIDVMTSRQIHQEAAAHHLLSLDAPVSGGVAGASAGSLTFMIGGEIDAYHKGQLILAAMGKKLIHTGQAGSGQAAKICNNMVLGISMVAISEAFVLAQQLGLSAAKLFEVINNSSGQCWALSQYVPVADVLENVPANRDYKPGFAATMMLKDLLLSQQSAENVAVKTPLGAKTTEIYQHFIERGFGELDFSAIIKLIEQQEIANA